MLLIKYSPIRHKFIRMGAGEFRSILKYHNATFVFMDDKEEYLPYSKWHILFSNEKDSLMFLLKYT